MKKILTSILLILLSLLLLTSCGKTEKGNEESTDVAKQTEEAAPANWKVPDVDKRTLIYNTMKEMSEVKWYSIKTIDCTDIAKTLQYDKAAVYTGLPYINLDRKSQIGADSDLEDFIEQLEYDEAKGAYKATTFTDRYNTYGNDCSSSVLISWAMLDGNIKATNTHDMLPLNATSGVYSVGEYKPGTMVKTADIIKSNGEEVMCNSYAALQKADAIIQHDPEWGHVRMVVENVVVKDDSGKIDPKQSHLVTIEQTNAKDIENKKAMTTWWVNHEYTYENLIKNNFIPITCNALKSTTFDNYADLKVKSVACDDAKSLAKATELKGNINSNYSIIKLKVQITSSDGTKIVDFKSKPRQYTVGLKDVDIKEELSGLAAGSYNYKVLVDTVCGKDYEVINFDFTK